jgi:hypothetical protein
MRKMKLLSVLAVSLLVFSPALAVLPPGFGAAHAKGEGSGGGKGKSESKKSESGKSEARSSGKGKSEAKSSEKRKAKQEKSAKSATNKKTTKAAEDGSMKAAKAKSAKAAGLAPNELGKMNGAMNANINAVLAHIRNGQTTKGPVGLLAGLAVADSSALAAAGQAAELEARAAEFDALQAKVEEAGFATVEDYLQARTDGTLTNEQLAVSGDIDTMIADLGGTDATGLQLAESRPEDAEIQAARDAAALAGQAVTDAEQAIIDAWNKTGDATALLDALRARLAPHQTEIDATVAETLASDETAVLLPEADEVIVVK